MKFETLKLPKKRDYAAPDGSEIRLLPNGRRGGLCHCTLPAKGVSQAVRHRTVEEIWYFVSGRGEVWRKQNGRSQVVKVAAGVSVTIPVGTHFQFRNTGRAPLRLIIATMPKWPGPHEAVRVKDHWYMS